MEVLIVVDVQNPGVDTSRIDLIIDKGHARAREGFSAFEDTELERVLRDRNVQTVHLAGLTLEYCVRATALDARAAGFDVVVHRDATRAVEVEPRAARRAVKELRDAGVEVVD